MVSVSGPSCARSPEQDVAKNSSRSMLSTSASSSRPSTPATKNGSGSSKGASSSTGAPGEKEKSPMRLPLHNPTTCSTSSSPHSRRSGASSTAARKPDMDLDLDAISRPVMPIYMYREILDAFSDDDFTMNLMMWSFKHCDQFPDEDPVDVEQKLEWTQLHQDYRAKFEERAEAVLQEAGYDVEKIIDEITKFVKNPRGFHLEADEDSIHGVLDALTASEDYIKFVRHMQSVKARKQWARNIMGDDAFEASGFFG
ncbi:unnamed protein product [Amoebophrya sp. A25]|nr:unnamed protein product [Amoebophrya sp. A25]|eukprot:GSA25T00012858001.1